MDAALARALWHYEPDTGVLRWRITVTSRAVAGDEAGFIRKDGYRYIRYRGKRYQAHRLAWLIVHGAWPAEQLDHWDRDRANNRQANLRSATNAQNAANRAKYAVSPCKGVSFDKRPKQHRKPWRARIQVNGHHIYLGTFVTPEEAHAAYYAAAQRHFGEFARAE